MLIEKSAFVSRTLLAITMISFAFSARGQKLSSRSTYEKRWAIFHPFSATKVKKIYKLCLPEYIEVKTSRKTDSFPNGGKLDAFRHVFFMAAFSQKINSRKVRKLGVAHERGNHQDFLKGIKEEGEIPDSLSTVMDLCNNELGIETGKENKKADIRSLKEKVLLEISEGKALYFKRDPNGVYVDCENRVINLSEYTGKWFIPKCLIPTSQ